MKKVLFKLFIVLFVLILGGFIVSLCLPQKIPILTYHIFAEEGESDFMTITKEDFEWEMKYLKKHHYHTLTIEEIECFLEDSCKLPRKSVAITIDDGWKGTLDIAAPILKEYDFNAIMFYIGKNSNGENESFLSLEDIITLKEKYPNIVIASHTYNLHEEDAYLKSKEELKSDFQEMNNILSTSYFAYPYGKYSESYIEVLKEEGFHLAFTFGPDKEHRKLTKKDDPYLIPRLNTSGAMPHWKFILRLNWFN